MNVVVLSEGASELGRCWKERDFLEFVRDDHLGALEIVLQRLGQVLGLQITIVSISSKLPQVKPGHIQRASHNKIIQNADLMKQVLLPCFHPGQPRLSSNAAQGAVVACDAELEQVVEAALTQVRRSISGPIVQITFKPEFETVLLEKHAMEQAAALAHCSIKQVPDTNAVRGAGGLKEAFATCVLEAGYQGSPHPASAEFKAKVARALSNDFLRSNWPAMEVCRKGISALLGG